MPTTTQLAAYGAALLLTLAACSRLTPRGWWRRPNLQAFGVAGAGTLLGGALLLALFGGAVPVAAQGEPDVPALEIAGVRTLDLPLAGGRYRVHDALNLRVAGGVGAARLLVVPAGSRVVATGRAYGDWWQVRATLDGREVEGWASSLWLRRADERIEQR